jgi:outer membrane protein TolC
VSTRWSLIGAVLLLCSCASAQAQQAADSLRLPLLLQQTLQADPRQRQLDLSARQSELRLRNIDAARKPTFTLEGLTQYQSDVVEFPLRIPGQTPPTPPHTTVDARLAVSHQVYDPTTSARRALERATLAETQARVHTSLFALRDEINEAFFAAAVLQERATELSTVIDDLEARQKEASIRVKEGTALPSEVAVLQATVLQRRQDLGELNASRRAALATLAELTGTPIRADAVIALPGSAAPFEAARCVLDSVRSRPEYEQFAAVRERLTRQADVIATQEKPRVSAFARVGYGRPGLNPMNDAFDSYWIGGVQVQWSPWNWGRVQREREELALQRESVAADEQAFALRLRRAVERDLAAVDRLQEALVLDNQIVALRERIERETKARFDEHVVTAAEYVDRRTDVAEARLARARRRVELVQAQVRFLTILGLEVQ